MKFTTIKTIKLKVNAPTIFVAIYEAFKEFKNHKIDFKNDCYIIKRFSFPTYFHTHIDNKGKMKHTFHGQEHSFIKAIYYFIKFRSNEPEKALKIQYKHTRNK